MNFKKLFLCTILMSINKQVNACVKKDSVLDRAIHATINNDLPTLRDLSERTDSPNLLAIKLATLLKDHPKDRFSPEIRLFMATKLEKAKPIYEEYLTRHPEAAANKYNGITEVNFGDGPFFLDHIISPGLWPTDKYQHEIRR